jgi:putative ABC transport system permease protein
MNKPQPQSGGHRRSLFLRLWLRSLTVKRPQAGLALASLLVGAALAAALLNLHGGVRRKMTQEFRAYGANVILSPRSPAATGSGPGLLNAEILADLDRWRHRAGGASLAPLLHVVLRLRGVDADPRLPEFQNVVAVGTDFAALRGMYPHWRLTPGATSLGEGECVVGAHVASRLRLTLGSELVLESAETGAAVKRAPFPCRVAAVLSTGAAEDDQVFVPLAALQRHTELDGKISLVELTVPGEADEIEGKVSDLARLLPSVDVRPVRGILESQGQVLGTIRWLLISLTTLILVIVGLCVMATMTTIVLERRKDVAVMKALGATDRLVMRLFLSEGAGLGLVGGIAGFGLGLLMARALGRSLFGVALHPIWWTLPLICLVSILIAVVATAFPVRMARAVQPATILKGD